ncbi:hypothetical protein Taro_039338 [Colocasia esculenta]|uniref:Uncharacterized protein n=1 Tax=Colocasia esculenta TaxID=4460 RepID=A0A843WLW6_COLES|nr:hypothetical protein [Colocasia esculenta]
MGWGDLISGGGANVFRDEKTKHGMYDSFIYTVDHGFVDHGLWMTCQIIYLKTLLQVIFLKPFPTTQRASSAASAFSSIAETQSWGRETGSRGPSKGAMERRIELGHKWNVRVIDGYGVETNNRIFRDLEMWYRCHQTPQTDKEMLKHMTTMHKGWRGILKSKHYKGKTFEDVVTSIPASVDPSDWRTKCENWNTREEQERMTQMLLPSKVMMSLLFQPRMHSVMGQDKPGRVHCAGKAETLRT